MAPIVSAPGGEGRAQAAGEASATAARDRERDGAGDFLAVLASALGAIRGDAATSEVGGDGVREEAGGDRTPEGAGGVGVAADAADVVASHGTGPAGDGTAEDGPSEVGAAEVGAAEDGPTEDGAAEDGTAAGAAVAAEPESSAPEAASAPGAGVVAPAAVAPAPSPSGASDRSLDRLHPELRRRVERVIERMRAEFGHEVEVVEGYRSPERQRALYAQGRTRPGPVVTWTRASLHSEGLAADLRVDGTWVDPVAYERLQRVAREVGLTTLGPRDPGHVEWVPPDRTALRAAASRTPSDPPIAGAHRTPAQRARVTIGARTVTATPAAAAVARVADAAEPAKVARTAGLAKVAAVAAAPETASRLAAADRPRSRPAAGADADDSEGRASVASTDTAGTMPGAAAGGPRGAQPTPHLAAVRGADPASSLARVLAVQDANAALPEAGASVRLTGLDGVVRSLRVGVIEGVVSADLDVPDPIAVREVEGRLVELRRALEGRGLEPGRIALLGGSGRADGALEAGTPGARPPDPAAEALKALTPQATGTERDARGGSEGGARYTGRQGGRPDDPEPGPRRPRDQRPRRNDP